MGTSMRILEALGEPIANGGEEAFVAHLIEKIDTTGLTIDTFTSYKWYNNDYKALMESKGGNVYSMDLICVPGKSRHNIYQPTYNFLKANHYDVIHIHSSSISALAIMAKAADRAGVKRIIVHSHATGERDDIKHKVLRFIAALSMSRHVDIYCACSIDAAKWKFEPRYVRKCHIIKNGIDTTGFRFDPDVRGKIRKKLELEDAFVIGHVGRFQPVKNHAYLIKIIEALPEAHLLLIGTGEDVKKTQKQAEQKHLEDRVHFLGYIKNIADYLQAMDVFVLPSLYEGLAIVAIEAQCTGLPVIASEHVPREVNLTGKVDFLPLKEDPELWVDHIRIARSPERKDQSRIIREKGYDISRTADIIREMYIKDK